MEKTLVHNHNKNETCEPCNIAMGMYECYWCKKWSYKENWGPGWVRCPMCKQLAPSVAEQHKIMASVVKFIEETKEV